MQYNLFPKYIIRQADGRYIRIKRQRVYLFIVQVDEGGIRQKLAQVKETVGSGQSRQQGRREIGKRQRLTTEFR